MRIIVEANIPYIKGLLEKFGDVAYLPASGITADAVHRADALLCAPVHAATHRCSTAAA